MNDSNLKEGDYIPIQGEGLNLLADDVRVGETVVGKLVYVKTDLNLPKSGNWYASEENINDSTHKLLGTQHWKIVFNKEIEKFQNPKIKIDIKNKRIEGHKNYKPNGGADITLSMKFGDKVLINETVKVEGLDKPKEKMELSLVVVKVGGQQSWTLQENLSLTTSSRWQLQHH